jgi:hypothetical protein
MWKIELSADSNRPFLFDLETSELPQLGHSRWTDLERMYFMAFTLIRGVNRLPQNLAGVIKWIQQ